MMDNRSLAAVLLQTEYRTNPHRLAIKTRRQPRRAWLAPACIVAFACGLAATFLLMRIFK